LHDYPHTKQLEEESFDSITPEDLVEGETLESFPRAKEINTFCPQDVPTNLVQREFIGSDKCQVKFLKFSRFRLREDFIINDPVP